MSNLGLIWPYPHKFDFLLVSLFSVDKALSSAPAFPFSPAAAFGLSCIFVPYNTAAGHSLCSPSAGQARS